MKVLVQAFTWLAVLLSIVLSMVLFDEKPATYRNESDERYGEGPSYALDAKQVARMKELIQKQGFITPEQAEEIADEASESKLAAK